MRSTVTVFLVLWVVLFAFILYSSGSPEGTVEIYSGEGSTK